MSDEKLVVNESPKKKISFFSAILIVLGGSIGAGIFLRSKSVLNLINCWLCHYLYGLGSH